ncbi:DUF418 domain-containing protein [Nonomuraea africana]|uniref:Membrane protein YeiB n=1 Tax=Nonomuraea africana TaxID=46171 RepID=A0ABR9KWA8_9ACTN|nr:DUF418 domain-containing protein [Nonomuraea africana]MBE1565918.1 putative membrane protein YeiB [Nonomuraea africana]
MTTTSVNVTARSLAPDLSRGFMLLLIALAHAPALVADWDAGPAWLTGTAKFVKSLVADNLARAMFVFLFGYGLGQMARRQTEWTSFRGLLRRRGLWLIVIGFANTVILVPIDIVAVYGLTLLAIAPIVRARDSVLLWTAGVTLLPATLMLAWQSVTALTAAAAGTPITMAEYMEPTLGLHLVASIPSWPVETALSTIMVVPGMLVGLWAARRKVLDEPERHLTLLRRAAVICLGVAVVGRIPAALMLAGVWPVTSTPVTWLAAFAHVLTGYFGGIGLAALVGLIAHRIGRDRGRVTLGLSALGQRSLTFYLFQSVVWVALFYPFALDLGDDMNLPATFGVAAAVWGGSILLADWMRRVGYRGPAEILLRRLTNR